MLLRLNEYRTNAYTVLAYTTLMFYKIKQAL